MPSTKFVSNPSGTSNATDNSGTIPSKRPRIVRDNSSGLAEDVYNLISFIPHNYSIKKGGYQVDNLPYIMNGETSDMLCDTTSEYVLVQKE